ncbi:MAG: amino acid adenylation domain-containing protein [Planctomycetota bacterium]|nr:amino acid adenylation domain-containing protein [Planctomycetota bacterium]
MSHEGLPAGSKTAAIDDRLRERFERARARIASPQSIPHALQSDVPATSLQRQLWFANDLVHGTALNHRPVVLDFSGPLNLAHLEKSLRLIVDRHQLLQLRMEVSNGLVVLSPALGEIMTIPVDELSRAAMDEEVEQCTYDEIIKSFDLNVGPLVRCRVLRRSDDNHRLIVTFHHTAFDGWSEGIFVGELRECYNAFADGRKPNQYVDYASWHNDRMTAPEAVPHREYWRKRLQDAPGLLDLPYDRRRPVRLSLSGAVHRFIWDKEFIDRLEQWGRNTDATLFMTLMAGFQALLFRYTNQSDFIVGTYSSGRHCVEVEPLIGLFAGPLPLRAAITDDQSFSEIVQLTSRAILDAFAHQSTPYSQMLLDMKPRRNLETDPLFQCVLQLRNYDGLSDAAEVFTAGDDESRILCRRADVDLRCSEIDLAFDFQPSHEGLRGRLRYSSDLFDRSTIEHIADCFRHFLEGAMTHPHEPIGRLSFIDDQERTRVVSTCNETVVEWPEQRCLHEYIEAQVRKTPDAEALVCEGHRVTYAELNRRANRIAHRLVELGVSANSFVAVSLERSPELMASLLAVLKAGGAYVPLEPDLPRERMRFLLDDTAVSIAIASGPSAELIAECDSRVIIIDPTDATLDRYASTDPQSESDPTQAAYVIYTSGSTGQPKGVVVEHAAIVNHLLWFQQEFQFGFGDRILQQTPFGFDVSVWELFVPLMCGATEIMARPDGHRDARYLAELIAREDIGTAHFVPSMLRFFLMIPGINNCTSLKRVFSSGEALPFDLVQQTINKLKVDIYNLYGPTETAVHITGCRCDANEPRGIVPIGKPLANCRVYVLDKAGQPVPVGFPGELYLGGVQVARGYLNRPELTAERFVPDPFSNQPGARMYKSGDLTRLLPDGCIEFLGRIDHQIKVHGVRIEAGEIEAALNALPYVKASTVIAREMSAGSNQIVAYVVYATGERPGIHELRHELGHRLPAIMIPSYFVELDSIPLTSSGKVNRKELPKPVVAPLESKMQQTEPETATQAALLSIWRDLLKRDVCEIHRDFFESGGDSLLAIGLILEIEKQLGVRIPATAILQHPTIVELAAEIERSTFDGDDLVELNRGEGGSPLFFLHTLGGQLLYTRNIIDHLDDRQPVFGVQQSASSDWLASMNDFSALARRYVDAIRTVQHHGPYRLTGYSYGGQLAHEIACQLRKEGESVSQLAIIDTGVRLSQLPVRPKRFSVAWTARFLNNLLNWFRDDLMRSSLQSVLYRIRRRIRLSWQRCLHFAGMRPGGDSHRRIEDFFSDDEILPQLRERMAKNLELLNHHSQHTYDGPLTIIKSQARPLFELCPPEEGWSHFVTGEISVHSLPGNHAGILKSPSVEMLATLLQSGLDSPTS